jgi:hypothetical protein
MNFFALGVAVGAALVVLAFGVAATISFRRFQARRRAEQRIEAAVVRAALAEMVKARRPEGLQRANGHDLHGEVHKL